MSDKEIKNQVATASSNTIVEVFTIDTTDIQENYLAQSPINEQIINVTNFGGFGLNFISIGGIRFICVPCSFSGAGRAIDGSQQKRPRLTISNFQGYGSYILKNTKNLRGARFYRKRMFAENLDAASFPQAPFWNTPQPTRYISEDSWIVNSVSNETPEMIELELISPIDFDNVRIPKRRMFSAYCDFEYRNSSGCAFGAGFGDGKPKTDDKNQPLSAYGITALTNRGEWTLGASYVSGDYVYLKSREKLNEFNNDYKKFFYTCKANNLASAANKPVISRDFWIPDSCSKTVQACALRFPSSDLRFGGFPGLTNKRYS